MKLKFDPQRRNRFQVARTGILVRAQNEDGKFENIDAVHLDASSMLVWLRSRGGYNPWAEQVLFRVLGYEDIPDLLKSKVDRLRAGIGVALSWDLDVQIHQNRMYVYGQRTGPAARELLELGWSEDTDTQPYSYFFEL